VLMGGRLFPTGNERELGVDTDDRSSSRLSHKPVRKPVRQSVVGQYWSK
jgi:hypothetical protein